MIAIAHLLVETSDDCNNVGPCCFTCPVYATCEQHYDEADEP